MVTGGCHADAYRNSGRAGLVVCFYLGLTGVAGASDISEEGFLKLAERCAPFVAPTTLASIARVESGYNFYALHNNATGESANATSAEAGMEIATRWLALGHSIDVGLMQINSKNFDWLGIGVEQALDPCTSIAAGARILSDGFAGGHTDDEKQAALLTALSRYNTGNPARGFQNGYVDKVVAAAKEVVPAIRVDGAEPDASTTPATSEAPSSAQVDWDVWGAYDARRVAAGSLPERETRTTALQLPMPASPIIEKSARLPRLSEAALYPLPSHKEEIE